MRGKEGVNIVKKKSRLNHFSCIETWKDDIKQNRKNE